MNQADALEKFYKNKFNENIFHVKSQNKSAEFIEDLDQNFDQEEVNKENFTITKPKRNTSLFSNKCSKCNKSILKDVDRSIYLKHNKCYICYIETEGTNNDRK